MSFVHCNACAGTPSSGQRFVMTSCGHVFCSKCLAILTKVPSKCPRCRVANPRTMEINSSLPSNMQSLFKSPRPVMKDDLESIQRIIGFQNSQRSRLLKYNQDLVKYTQKKGGECAKQLAAAKKHIIDLQNELKRQMQKQATSARTTQISMADTTSMSMVSSSSMGGREAREGGGGGGGGPPAPIFADPFKTPLNGRKTFVTSTPKPSFLPVDHVGASARSSVSSIPSLSETIIREDITMASVPSATPAPGITPLPPSTDSVQRKFAAATLHSRTMPGTMIHSDPLLPVPEKTRMFEVHSDPLLPVPEKRSKPMPVPPGECARPPKKNRLSTKQPAVEETPASKSTEEVPPAPSSSIPVSATRAVTQPAPQTVARVKQPPTQPEKRKEHRTPRKDRPRSTERLVASSSTVPATSTAALPPPTLSIKPEPLTPARPITSSAAAKAGSKTMPPPA